MVHPPPQGVKANTINSELRIAGHFLDFKGLPNVAWTIRLKGDGRRIPHGLYTEKELDDIYEKFPGSRNVWTHENTLRPYHIILGLKIYQGLQGQELSRLETGHLQLDKGKICPIDRTHQQKDIGLKTLPGTTLAGIPVKRKAEDIPAYRRQQAFSYKTDKTWDYNPQKQDKPLRATFNRPFTKQCIGGHYLATPLKHQGNTVYGRAPLRALKRKGKGGTVDKLQEEKGQ